MTYNYRADWCSLCATRDGHDEATADRLCAQCKLPQWASVPTMFGDKQGGDAQ